MFELIKKDLRTQARAGILTTNHGLIETPVFMPVGTLGTVKGVTLAHLNEIDPYIILGNTYHLYLRPGCDVIQRHGGLHEFMGWKKPILTDSGGYQVFSLNQLRKISDKGIEFRSHIDGSKCFLGPNEVMGIQAVLNSDIAMCLDECAPYPSPYEDLEEAVRRTLIWSEQCRQYQKPKGQLLFGIIQGGMDPLLRQRCAKELIQMDFDGYAIGGLSVGEPDTIMYEVLDSLTPDLPQEKPRYLMGVGTPLNLLESVSRGVDMFDCVMPTRNGRNGMAFTFDGPLNLKNAQFKQDLTTLSSDCLCYTCRHFTKSYIRHLFVAKEMLGPILVSIHNLHFYVQLMKQTRGAILNETFDNFYQEFKEKYLKSDT